MIFQFFNGFEQFLKLFMMMRMPAVLWCGFLVLFGVLSANISKLTSEASSDVCACPADTTIIRCVSPKHSRRTELNQVMCSCKMFKIPLFFPFLFFHFPPWGGGAVKKKLQRLALAKKILRRKKTVGDQLPI